MSDFVTTAESTETGRASPARSVFLFGTSSVSSTIVQLETAEKSVVETGSDVGVRTYSHSPIRAYEIKTAYQGKNGIPTTAKGKAAHLVATLIIYAKTTYAP